MRILVSDLLYSGEPAALLRSLAAGAGCALVFAPVRAGEARLEERGNVELVDSEGGAGRRQRIDDELANRYQAAYARHFTLWAEASRRAGVGLARLDCAGTLTAALSREAYSRGVVASLVG